MTSASDGHNAHLGTKIVDVQVRYLGLPTGMKSFVLPNGHRTPTDLAALLVHVRDDDGATGTSMLWAQRHEHLPLYEAMLRYLVLHLDGQQLADVDSAVGLLRQAATFVGQEGVTAFGISGLEMALQDLSCHRRNSNLSRDLGRRRDKVQAYQTGLMISSTIDELIAEAAAIHERGLRAIKMIVGKPDIREDVERISAVRASLPTDTRLMVDALQRWNASQALDAATHFADLGLVWIEDPLPHHDVDGYAALVRESPIKVSTGETCFSRESFEKLLDIGIPYLIAELERVGGISGWMRTARLAHERNIAILPHIYPHVSAQLISALPQDEVWWEYVSWFDQLMDAPFDISDGLLTVPDECGTGFTPSPDRIEKLAQGPWIPLVA